MLNTVEVGDNTFTMDILATEMDWQVGE